MKLLSLQGYAWAVPHSPRLPITSCGVTGIRLLPDGVSFSGLRLASPYEGTPTWTVDEYDITSKSGRYWDRLLAFRLPHSITLV